MTRACHVETEAAIVTKNHGAVHIDLALAEVGAALANEIITRRTVNTA